MTDKGLEKCIAAWFLENAFELGDPANEFDDVPQNQIDALTKILKKYNVRIHDAIGPVSSPESRAFSGPFGKADPIVGKALGRCFATSPTQQILRAAERIIKSPKGWDNFAAATASEIGKDERKQYALRSCLEELVNAFTSAPRRIVLFQRHNTCDMVENYGQYPRIDNIWRGLDYSTLTLRHIPAFDALRLADPSSFLWLLDQFPNAEPVQHILAYAADRMEIDDILKLLALAQECFDEDSWLPWVKTPITLLTEVEVRLAMLATNTSDKSLPASVTFSTMVEKTVNCVIDRVDGNNLGHAWLQHLIQSRFLGSRRRTPRDHPGLACPATLPIQLAAALRQKRDPVAWVKCEDRASNRYRAVAAIAPAAFGQSGSPEAAILLMKKLLPSDLSPIGLAENGFARSENVERALLALIIRHHPRPLECFSNLWRDLAPARDRARHIDIPGEQSAHHATLIAISWFMFGLDGINPHSSAYRSLWQELLSAVHECAALQADSEANAAWRSRYCFLAAHLADRLGESKEREFSADLKDLIEPLLCLEMTIAGVVIILLDRKVPPFRITSASGGPIYLTEILQRLKSEQIWVEAQQPKQLGRSSNFSSKIALAVDQIRESN